MRVGLVIPCYREHETIAKLIREVHARVPDLTVVVVDDSPDDLTARATEPLLDETTILIRRRSKGGRGSAVIEGLRHLATLDTDVALEMDADMSHPPAQIPELLTRLRAENLDMLIASRYVPGSQILNWPLSRRIFSALSNRLARGVLRVPVSDYTNGFRCYSKNSIRVITEECGRLGSGFIALSEILVNVYYRGLRVGEVPTTFINRVRGESSLGGREIFGALVGLVAIRNLKVRLTKGVRS